jgi:hypothetical protein
MMKVTLVLEPVRLAEGIALANRCSDCSPFASLGRRRIGQRGSNFWNTLEAGKPVDAMCLAYNCHVDQMRRRTGLPTQVRKHDQGRGSAMKRLVICLMVLSGVALTVDRAAAQHSGEAEIVQGWYQKYLKRNADPPSLYQFASQLRQGVPQVEIQGTILGSDEYFNRYGRRPDDFIRGLYADALDRRAGNPEIRVWVQRLRDVNGDRSELAKRFLRSAESEQVTGGLRPIDLVRLWYRKYLDRDVDPSGVERYVGLLRAGSSPLDCQAELLGSDEYFNRQGGTIDGFIAGLFRDVLGRNPNRADLRSWRNTFARNGNNRQVLARQFLGQAGVQVDNNAPPLPPPTPPPGTNRDMLAQIIQRSEQFTALIQAEIPGSLQGRQCILRAQALQTAAVNLRSQFASNAPPGVLVRSLNSLERAYDALRERLARPPGTAPKSEQVANHIGMLINALKSIPPFNGGGGPPVPPPPPNAGYDQAAVLNLLNSTQGNIAQLLRSMSGTSFIFQGLRRDIEGFSRQIEAIRQQVQRGEPLPTVQRTVFGAKRYGASITDKMRHPTLPTYWQQIWVNVEHGLASVSVALQVNAGAPQPGGLPPQPGFPGAALIAVIDSLAGEIDAYLASIAPMMAFNPQYFPLQAQLNSMRGNLLEMRQTIAVGASPLEFRPQFVEVQQNYLQLTNLFNAILGANPAFPPPSLDGISARFNELARTMPQ